MSMIPVAAGAASGPFVTTGIATAISMFWISLAAGVDRMWRQLPDPLVVLALLPTAMAAAVLTLQGSTTALTGSGFGAIAWALPVLFVHLVAPVGLGFGDVKAAAVIGATLGLTQPTAAVACGLVGAFALAALKTARSPRRDVALGPFLVAGGCLCLGVSSLAGEV